MVEKKTDTPNDLPKESYIKESEKSEAQILAEKKSADDAASASLRSGQVAGSASIVPKLNDSTHEFDRLTALDAQDRKDNKYEFIKFDVGPKSIKSNKIGCFAPSEGSNQSALNMSPIDNNLYSPELCALNVALKMSDIKMKSALDPNASAPVTQVAGLYYKMVDGYFADNLDYFDKRTDKASGLLATGLVNDFSTWQRSIDWANVKPKVDRFKNLQRNPELFSIEWTGYFKPDVTGNWTFQTTSDDSSLLWIDNNSSQPTISYKTTNLSKSAKDRPIGFLNNSGLHGDARVAININNINLTAGKMYPIRMMFGQNYGGIQMQLSIRRPNGTEIKDGAGIFFSYITADGKPGKPNSIGQMYYALAENTPQDTRNNLFKCLTTQDTLPTKSDITYKVVWQALDPQSESALIKQDNYVELDAFGNLLIRNGNRTNQYNDNQNIVKSVNNEQKFGPSYKFPPTEKATNEIAYLKNYFDPKWSTDYQSRKNPGYYRVPKDMPYIADYGWSYGSQYGHNPTGYLTYLLYLTDSGQLLIYKTKGWRWEFMRQINSLNQSTGKHVTSNSDKQSTIPQPIGITPNPEWIQERQSKGIQNYIIISPDGPNTTKPLWQRWWEKFGTVDQIYRNGSENKSIISYNGQYKLEINEVGNLVLKYSVKGCSTKNQYTTYTASDSNSYYLYEASSDPKMGKMYYSEAHKDKPKTLEYIPQDSSILTYANTYKNGGNYAPASTAGETTVSNQAECAKKCTDSACKYYYHYKKADGKEYCVADATNQLPTAYVSNSPNSPYKNSKLYVRESTINLDQTQMPFPVPIKEVNAFSEYAGYNDYKMVNPSWPHPVGYKMNKEWKKWQNNENQIMHKQAFSNMVDRTEGFDGAINIIQSNQIDPLMKISSSYSNKLNQMSQNYTDLSGNIDSYNSLHKDLSNNNKKYNFNNIGADGKSILYYKDIKTPTVADGVQEDINIMLVQQNTMYIVGAVTAATLLVSALFIGGSNSA
jgi:hypothetical protein